MNKSININTILNLLRSNNYITVNKSLIKNVGVVAATMYSELCSRYHYFLNQGTLKDGFFYATINDISNNVGLSRDEQDTALKKLIKLGLVEKKVAKMKGDEAPKRYLKITDNIDLILNLLNCNQVENVKKDTESTENNRFVEIPQIDNVESRKSTSGIPAANKNNNNNKEKEKNQSVSQKKINKSTESKQENKLQEDRLTDELQTIYDNARIELFEDDELKDNLRDTITTAFQDLKTKSIITKLKLEHIDIAISNYTNAQIKQEIKNPRAYFLRCIISAIEEFGLKKLF